MTVGVSSIRPGMPEDGRGIDTRACPAYSQAMEIALTIEQEALLLRIAALEGKRADELAVEVLSRGLRAGGSCSGRVAFSGPVPRCRRVGGRSPDAGTAKGKPAPRGRDHSRPYA